MRGPGSTLVVGLDACDHRTAAEFAAAGHMPVLRGLLDKAARCPLRLPPGLFVNAVWPGFTTGLRADRHTFHCWDEIEVASYKRRLTTARQIVGKPFWRRLGAAGRSTVSIDVPHTVVQGEENCLEIAEWGTHDRHFGLQISPPAEGPAFECEFGLHPVFGMDARIQRSFAPDDYMFRAGPRRTAEEDRQLIDAFLTGIETKRRLSEKYLRTRDWDLFITVFGESHAVGHQQWHLHDPLHRDFDPLMQKSIGGDPILRVYAGLDAALGKLMAAVDDRTAVLVLLSHGMGPHNDGTHLLDEVLRRIDLADRIAAGESWSNATGRRFRALRRALKRAIRRLTRPGHTRPARRSGPKGGGLTPAQEFVSPGERAEQRFFLEPNNGVYGGVRLNRAGREPKGRVAAETMEAVIAALERDLRALVNVETGGPVIRGVERAERWYRRFETDTMPDLFLDWERSAPIETVWSEKTGMVHAPYVNWRTGDHRPRGLLLAAGPGIAAGAELPEMAIEDLPASLMARFGVEHGDMDGQPAGWLAG